MLLSTLHPPYSLPDYNDFRSNDFYPLVGVEGATAPRGRGGACPSGVEGADLLEKLGVSTLLDLNFRFPLLLDVSVPRPL